VTLTRPLRIYRLTFVRGADKLDIVRSGVTPCRARAAAYVALERRLVDEHKPRDGWRLAAQADVTHLATV
jgi:hypothetical protein